MSYFEPTFTNTPGAYFSWRPTFIAHRCGVLGLRVCIDPHWVGRRFSLSFYA